MAARPSRYEHTRCFRRGWVFERVGWVAMGVALSGAALGLFGNGWLSGAKATASRGALTVQYPRLCRAHAPHELRIAWQPRTQEAGLWIARSYLDRFEIHEIRPAPVAVGVGPDRIHYSFRAVEPGARVEVVFTLKPVHGGSITGRIGSDGELDVEVRQLVFP